MENLESYKKRIKAIEELSNRLESGELSIDELVTLETLTRELYERTVILKYKAFENKVNPIIETPVKSEVDTSVSASDSITYTSDEIAESEPTIDFSIFDEQEEIEEISTNATIQMNEEAFPEVVESTNEKETVVLQFEEKESTMDEVVEEKVADNPSRENHSASQGQSFWEQLNMNNNSLSTQFEGAKIDTLVGAFGLNEKLGYINELFDGSSESFSDAIKVLDTQSNLDAAKIKASELALKHGWNVEEESVVDFLTMVNRRYA